METIVTHIDFASGDANCNDVIKAADNGQACSRNCKIQSDKVSSRDITPNWRPVDCIVVPYEGIDKEDQAAESNPYHVKAHPSVPS